MPSDIISSNFDRGLFADRTKDILDFLFTLLKAQENNQRKFEAKKRLDFYHGIQTDYTVLAMEKVKTGTGDKPNQIRNRTPYFPQFINITKNLIDSQAVLFKYPPVFKIKNGKKKDLDIWLEVVKSGKLNLVMKQVNRYCKLLKTVLLHPVWRDDRIEFDILTPNVVDVVQDDLDPTKAQAIVYERVNDNTVGKNRKLFVYWDAETHFLYDQNKEPLTIEGNESGINPYGVLPFIVFRDYLPLDSFWLEGGDDIINNNEAVNVHKTNLGQIIFMQAFAQAVAVGLPEGTQIPVGVDVFVSLPRSESGQQPTDFKFVKPDADIDQVNKAIQDMVKQLAVTNKVPVSTLDPIPREESGEALRVSQLPLTEIREDDIEIYRAGLEELFELIKIMLKSHRPEKAISDKAQLEIEFSEIDHTLSPKEEFEFKKAQLDAGLISQVDFALYFNENLNTEDEALEYLRKVKKINDEFKSGTTPAPDISGSMNGGV